MIKNEIERLREEIKEIEEKHKLKPARISFDSMPEISLLTESYDKMLQGDWTRLGIGINSMMESSIRYDANKREPLDDEHEVELKVDQAIQTAQMMCKGFFDTWEKEIDELRLKYFESLRKRMRVEIEESH